MVNLKNFKNLYEVRKTVRFELKPYKKTRELLKWKNNYQSLDSYIKHIKDWEFEDWFDWNDFCLWKYEDFLKESKKYYWFLFQINAEIQKWRNDTTKKNIHFDLKKSKGIFKNIPSLKKIQWFEWLKSKLLEIQDEYQNYFNFFDQLQHKQHKNEKKSDISIYLRKIAYLNRNLFTIFNFFDTYKTNQEILDKKKEIIDYDFEKLNNSIIASHENEISGACFWKFTFNKFALFRREASLLKEKLETNKQVLQKAVATMVADGEIINDNWTIVDINTNQIHSLTLQKKICYSLKFEEEIWTLQGRLEKFNFNRNLDEVISELDDINGQLLNQYIQNFVNGYKNDENILEVSFYTDHEGNEIFDKSKKYDSYENGQKKEKFYPSLLKLDLEQFVEAQKRNQIKIQPGQTLEWYQYINLLGKDELANEEKEQKKLLNKFLQILFKQEFINPDYNTIKKFRDTLAKYRWKLRQNVRTSEREFIQEAMVRYYGQILEKDGCYFVALFDKDNLQNDIKNIVTDSQTKDTWTEGDSFKIYKYSQLSFSALEKLCLSKDSDLLTNLSLQKAWDKYKNQKKEIEWRCDFHKNWQDKDCTSCKNNKKEMIRSFLNAFKKHILQALEKLKKDEKYKWEDWSYLYWELQQKNSVEDIVNFINQKFYKLEEKYIDQEQIFELAEAWEILLFQIYSKDFNIFNSDFVSDEENLRDYEKDTWESQKTIEVSKREDGKQENLFTAYFKNIFKSDWDTYLGQEWGIFFRKADSESDKKRFRNDKFFISLDILFNKGKEISKSKMCEKKEKIQNNKREQLNKITKECILDSSWKIKDNVVLVWIDRWKKEHLSIGFYNSKLKFEWIIGNTNFVKKIKKNTEQLEVLFKSQLTYFEGNEKDIYEQIQLNCFYFNEKGEEEYWKYLEVLWLQDYHIKKIFQKDQEWVFFSELKDWGKFILNKWSYWYKILDGNWKEVKLVDKADGKEVIDYYLLFESERYKRILDINTELQYANNMRNLKKGYIAIIKDYFKRQIKKFEEQGKWLVFVFENQSTNKWKNITKDYMWASIISDVEDELLNSFSYLLYKNNTNTALNGIQLGINVKKSDLISSSKKWNTENKKYEMFAHFLFVNPDYTSEACPICNWNFIQEVDKNWKVVEKEGIKKLFGHWRWKEFENSMHHYSENNKINYGGYVDEAKKTRNDNCDYHIGNENYPEFKFIKSWDDLATYNIAKKAKEYLESLPKKLIPQWS